MRRTQLDDLVRKYLDRRATDAECADLERLLVESPLAAEAFAQASRMDACLRALLRGERDIAQTRALFEGVERQRSWRRWAAVPAWLGVAAAVLILVVGAVLHGLSKPAPSTGQTPAPVASGPNEVLTGQVLVDGQPAKSLPDGASIRVPEAATVRLADGSRVEFEPASQAVLVGPSAGLRQVVELVAGAGTFAVEKGAGQFQVDTRLGRVTALGTKFTVKLLPADKLVVDVAHGIVQVDFAGRTAYLTAGDQQAFSPRGDLPRKPKELRGFFRGFEGHQLRVLFEGEKRKEVLLPLADAVAVLIDGKLAAREDLTKEMAVYLQRREGDDGPVFVIRAEGPTMFVQVRSVDPEARTITLMGRKGDGGKVVPDQTFPLAETVEVTVDGQPAQLADVRPGVKAGIRMAATEKKVVAIAVLTRK